MEVGETVADEENLNFVGGFCRLGLGKEGEKTEQGKHCQEAKPVETVFHDNVLFLHGSAVLFNLIAEMRLLDQDTTLGGSDSVGGRFGDEGVAHPESAPKAKGQQMNQDTALRQNNKPLGALCQGTGSLPCGIVLVGTS
jgi:hypothetical protein